jgi:hypothetical protein
MNMFLECMATPQGRKVVPLNESGPTADGILVLEHRAVKGIGYKLERMRVLLEEPIRIQGECTAALASRVL